MEPERLQGLLKEGAGSGPVVRIPENWWLRVWGGRRGGGRTVFIRPAAIADLKMGSEEAARGGELSVGVFQWSVERMVEGLRMVEVSMKPWEAVGLDVGTSGWRAYCVAGETSVEIVRVLRSGASEERIDERPIC